MWFTKNLQEKFLSIISISPLSLLSSHKSFEVSATKIGVCNGNRYNQFVIFAD
jgi:hypothetical protein